MQALVRARREGVVPDAMLFLEHTPVITLGTSARETHLLASRATLRRHGVDLARSARGGDITYHAPGQLILYPILALAGAERDVHDYVARLEEIAIATAADCGVQAFRRKGKTGAWTAHGKLAALGVRVSHWITWHGLSFNVNVDLAGFGLIVPCGLHGEAVTSLRSILGRRCPALSQVRDSMSGHCARILGRRITLHPLARHIPHPALQRLWREAVREPDAAGAECGPGPVRRET